MSGLNDHRNKMKATCLKGDNPNTYGLHSNKPRKKRLGPRKENLEDDRLAELHYRLAKKTQWPRKANDAVDQYAPSLTNERAPSGG